MKKITNTFLLILMMHFAFAQNSKFTPYAQETLLDKQGRVHYLKFKETKTVAEKDIAAFLNALLFGESKNKVAVLKTERDELGFTHTRFNIYQNDVLISDKQIVTHSKNGKLLSMNGDLYDFNPSENGFSLSEAQALTFATNKVGAQKYKWENKTEEQHMREVLNDANFTYQPHGLKTLIEKDGKLYAAYRFNIYAEQPLYRANVFVNASNGQILEEQNLICDADVPGSANTKYSGTQTITCDQVGSQYRLLESGRGNGIETYDLGNSTSYAASTNFINTSAVWTSTNTDQGATDAHWGAEKTYDYFLNEHNRNSINNAGFKLISYVHYGTNYVNAFWDGSRMTYGDGNGGSMKIFTALDVCAHEITHGLTSNSANLIYSYESGALNESYSDIFGACVENFARPTNWNWRIGEDITSNNNGIRNMANPKSFNNPHTYGGQYWFTGAGDNGGVHRNSGVSNYWFYLLTVGGAGTNDLSNAYTVQSIGMNSAARIAFRALTVYYTPTTNYATARNLSIQAAKDLFGDCSNEVIQTINAWHAVGIGNKFTPGVVTPEFKADFTNFCTLPATVNFENTTPFASTYVWSFGDGSTATSTNAVHTYTANGNYTIKLKASGCANATDSLSKTAYVKINVPVPPTVGSYTVCEYSSATITANGGSNVKWFNNTSLGQVIATGNTLNANQINPNLIYYAASTSSNASAAGGILTNIGGSYLGNSAQWLIFDVVQSGTLNSVVVYASTVGTRTIELRNSTNVTIQSIPVNLSVGANTVMLYMSIPVGTNYRLALGGATVANLYRTNSGVSFPYYVGDCVKITNSSAGAGFYYWFYNWTFTKDDCLSPLVPVNFTFKPAIQASVVVPEGIKCVQDEVPLTGIPSGGTYSGAGVAGQVFNASSLGAGTHSVFYTYNDGAGCSITKSAAVEVSECTSIFSSQKHASAISIFPNPSSYKIYVSGLSETSSSIILINDLAGRTVLQLTSIATEQEININELTNGLYLIKVLDSSQKPIKTIKFVKD